MGWVGGAQKSLKAKCVVFLKKNGEIAVGRSHTMASLRKWNLDAVPFTPSKPPAGFPAVVPPKSSAGPRFVVVKSPWKSSVGPAVVPPKSSVGSAAVTSMNDDVFATCFPQFAPVPPPPPPTPTPTVSPVVKLRTTGMAAPVAAPALTSGTSTTHPKGVLPADIADERTTECIMCMDKVRSVVFVPCGHLGVCAGCAAQCMSGTSQCPTCDKPIARMIDLKRDQT